MDFVKTSEAYGYETIAEAEERALAAKYEEGRDEGIGIGMERGREEGDLNARREMAKGFRDVGIPVNIIAKQTGFSEEEIRNL